MSVSSSLSLKQVLLSHMFWPIPLILAADYKKTCVKGLSLMFVTRVRM